MATYSLDGRLGRLIVRGGRLRADVADRVVAASLSMTTDEVTQLDVTLLEDERFTLLRSGLFEAGTETRAGSRCDYGGLALEVRAVEVYERGADHALRVTARSLGAGRLRRERGPSVRRKLSPTQFAELEARQAGLRFVGQPSERRPMVQRRKDETAWEHLQRLAESLQYVCFEAAGTVYFGKPTWLVGKLDTLRVTWAGDRTSDDLDALPRCRRSADSQKRVVEVTAMLRGDLGERALPGMALQLAGVPSFEGRYLVNQVSLNLGEGEAAEVVASTPVNPEKVTTGGGGGAAGDVDLADAVGAKSAAAFVALALEQAGDNYIYGAETAGQADPNAFDCSELVQWAAGRAGVPFVDGSSAQIAACKPITVEEAIGTAGALLWHPGHIAISLGTGKTIEAANSRVGVVSYNAAGRFQRGGLIPGMRY